MGSGRTELLEIIMGLIKDFDGSIYLDNKQLNFSPLRGFADIYFINSSTNYDFLISNIDNKDHIPQQEEFFYYHKDLK